MKPKTIIILYIAGGVVGYLTGIGFGLGIIIALLIHLFIYFSKSIASEKQKRYIPESVKAKVRIRYFGMCAVCPETNYLEYHHKIPLSEGGDGEEKNVTILCPKHHAMLDREKKGG